MRICASGLTACLAAVLALGTACDSNSSQRAAAAKAVNAQPATLQACGDYTTPAGKPVQAYVVRIADHAENLLLVVGGTGPVAIENANTVKIGDKVTKQQLRWVGGSSGWIIALNGDAQVIASGLGDTVGSSRWNPDSPDAPYKFPVHLLKKFTEGKTLKLPELDGPPEK